jgi:hypothetical protein
MADPKKPKTDWPLPHSADGPIPPEHWENDWPPPGKDDAPDTEFCKDLIKDAFAEADAKAGKK